MNLQNLLAQLLQFSRKFIEQYRMMLLKGSSI